MPFFSVHCYKQDAIPDFQHITISSPPKEALKNAITALNRFQLPAGRSCAAEVISYPSYSARYHARGHAGEAFVLVRSGFLNELSFFVLSAFHLTLLLRSVLCKARAGQVNGVLGQKESANCQRGRTREGNNVINTFKPTRPGGPRPGRDLCGEGRERERAERRLEGPGGGNGRRRELGSTASWITLLAHRNYRGRGHDSAAFGVAAATPPRRPAQASARSHGGHLLGLVRTLQSVWRMTRIM